MRLHQSRAAARGLRVALTVAGMAALAAPALASEITIIREQDSNNYDPPRTTAFAGVEVLFMLTDSLVSLSADMKTVEPLLAKSWTTSDDGLTYTFDIRDDVTFCDGKPMTAEDIAYSLNRWNDPETRSTVRWRLGDVRAITATDATTLVYELNKPRSDLLFQLAQSFGGVIDKATVDALGDSFGVTGFNGTGPFCWESWTPRDKMVMTRHEGYNWGPLSAGHTGPAQVDRITWQIVPEAATRTAALLTGQGHVSPYVPFIGLETLRNAPGVEVVKSDAAFLTTFIGFKTDRDLVSDKRVRQALNLAVDQAAIAEDLNFGEVDPAYSYISEGTLDWNPAVEPLLLRHDLDRARALLEDAGWMLNANGLREKDGKTLSPLFYTFTGASQRTAEAVQANLRDIGVDLQVESYDPTAYWGKLSTQDYDMFMLTFPYISAGDALNLYFHSSNMPSPNRMNWNDAETDEMLDKGVAALNDADRAAAYGRVQEIIHEAAIWLPVNHRALQIAYSTKLKPFAPHNIYGAALYKGLQLGFAD